MTQFEPSNTSPSLSANQKRAPGMCEQRFWLCNRLNRKLSHQSNAKNWVSRHWCSMRLCGNRLEVAAYAARRRLPITGRPAILCDAGGRADAGDDHQEFRNQRPSARPKNLDRGSSKYLAYMMLAMSIMLWSTYEGRWRNAVSLSRGLCAVRLLQVMFNSGENPR